METKKSLRADIEKERPVYFLMGFIVVLSSFFVLMEWESMPPDELDWQSLIPVYVESEFIGNVESLPPFPISEEVVLEIEIPQIVYEDYKVVEDVIPIDEFFTDSPSSPIVETETLPEETKETEESLPEGSPESDEVYTNPDVFPEFPGGRTALSRFILQNTQYPSVALKQRIKGRVWCSFIVNKDGSVSTIQIEQGVYSFLDDEALRVLNLMPSWVPGRSNGQTVRVKVYLPIVFKY